MITIKFLGQCGFIISTEKFSIAIDPLCNDLLDENGNTILNYPPVCTPEELDVDYIFCTHDHIDHMAQDTLVTVSKCSEKTIFIVPKGCVEEMVSWGIAREWILAFDEGQNIVMGDNIFSWKAFSAAHPVHQVDENGNNHNQVFCLEIDGKKLVHLGDTYLTDSLLADLKSVGQIDVLFPPINGRDEEREAKGIIGNLNYQEAADLAISLNAGLVIPTHFDMVKGNIEDPEKFVSYLQQKDQKRKYWIPNMQENLEL